MKALIASLVLFASLNVSVAQKKPNLDDPKVQDEIIAIAATELEFRRKGDGSYLGYLPRKQTPYTGWYASSFYNSAGAYGQLEHLYHLKDGKQDGLEVWLYKTGQMKKEESYKDGKLLTCVSWKPNGEKCPVTNVVDGNGVLVLYYEKLYGHGKDMEVHYKDSKRHGIFIRWNEDGTERVRWTYKDGVKVED